MKQKTLIKRVVSLALALTMCAAVVTVKPVEVTADTKQQTLQKEKDAAQSKLDDINKQIKANEAEKKDAQELKSQYQQQSNLITQQISILTSQIADLEEQIQNKSHEIELKQEEVNQKQAEHDARWAGFKERMASMQMLNDGGAIALLSSATNLYELLTFTQTLEEITAKDTEICRELEQERIDLNNQKEALESAKQELEANQTALQDQNNQLSAKVGELAANIKAQDATISAADAEAKALEAAAAEARKEVDRAAAELDAYLNSLVSQFGAAAITCSKNFMCPVASYKYVSCQFGVGGHKGVDLAAPGNTPIYAVADGVVMTAAYHYSYGNYVFLNNGTDTDGNTYTTLYAHMIKAPSVSAGQTVSKGQVLGYVGSTGNSTGNHLHFEMKVNGSRVNPLLYVPH